MSRARSSRVSPTNRSCRSRPASALGSSSHLINGPTGAVSLVVFSALSFIDTEARLDAYEAMFLLAAMIGLVQNVYLRRL